MILIFAGAGASKAVNPNSYPTTVEFFEKLPKPVLDDSLFREIINFHSTANDSVLDIEILLSILSDTRSISTTATNDGNFLGWLTSSKRINNVINSRIDIQPFINLLNGIANKSSSLESQINTLVYDFYSRIPTSEEIQNNWVPLLQLSLKHYENVEIFTTNYDMIIEQSINDGNYPINYGRTTGITSTLNISEWKYTKEIAKPTGHAGRLTKLHGSVDWTLGSDNIYVGNPTFRGRHEEHVILYPGAKLPPHKEPFDVFHKYFAAAAKKATTAVFIGFAFRDEDINNILKNNLNSSCDVIIINPTKIVPPFKPDQITYLKLKFDLSAIAKLKQIIIKTRH